MKKRTQILLEPRQIAQLKKESARTGAPIGELVRRAIDHYFKYPAKSKRRRQS